jgi:hypothetical protein
MPLDQQVIADFRRRLREAVENNRETWAASRRLVAPSVAAETLRRLHAAVAGSSLDSGIRQALLQLLAPADDDGLHAIPQEGLRELTGLNPTKAVRNLCLLLGVGADPIEAGPVSSMTQEKVEAAVRGKDNPFDVLLEADVASIVDCGAGDLTFEEKVIEQYLSPVERAGRVLTLHAFDRLDPQGTFSAFVQADRDRLHRLRRHASPALRFHYDGNRDMLDLASWRQDCARYTIAVCNSPATPTFAFEPSRLGHDAIRAHLLQTKGEFRRVKTKGREVLEVVHGGERLTFPPWKFDVYGPLALLDLLSRKGKLCILSAVDMEVFCEVLSQLLPEETARPSGVFFTEGNVSQFLGAVYDQLLRLGIGQKMILPKVRQDIPRVLGDEGRRSESYGFRSVEIRRGAHFPGVPAGRTAYLFDQMKLEAAPWFLTLVPAT